jgi:fumarate reductase subunit D
MNYLHLAWDFLVKSSADPTKYSLTVKGTLLAAVPVVMQVLGFACTFGQVCIDMDADLLTAVAQSAGTLVFHILTVLGMGLAFYGLVRKVWLTLTGQNDVVGGYFK